MDAPLLDCCFSDTNCDVAFSASANYSVYQHHLSQNKSTPIGRHDAGVRSVRYSSRTQSVISGGWDAKVHIWDVKSSTARTGSFEAPGKVYSMSLNENYLLIATSNRQVALYDLRNTDTHVFLKESPLKYQTRCVELCPDNTGFIIGSIEGRVGVEYISQEKKGYSFKCHRQTVDGKTYIFPVNSIAFHPYGTFATGGCDGVICVWDGIKKKRISQFRTYPTRYVVCCLRRNKGLTDEIALPQWISALMERKLQLHPRILMKKL